MCIRDRDGDGLYRNVSNIQPAVSTTAKVRQGMLEASNVAPVIQITRLIEVTRAYESISKLIDNAADLSAQTINRLGHVT